MSTPPGDNPGRGGGKVRKGGGGGTCLRRPIVKRH